MRASVEFGEELRKRRLEAGLSLTGLSTRVHYSKAHLSKVERGLKRPSGDLARLCDAALDAGGALAVPAFRRNTDGRAAHEGIAEGNHPPRHIDEEVRPMGSSPVEGTGSRPIGRRRVMATGAGAAMAVGATGMVWPASAGPASPGAEHGPPGKPGGLVEGARSLFDHYRRVGQTVDPDFLLPALVAQTRTLREAAGATGGADSRALLLLGSRYAEYVGWLVQETGDDHRALEWTRLAVELAEAAGDEHLAGYALTRHALITMYRGDARRTVALSREAAADHLPTRIRGLAAQHEAQGHALAGDHSACMRGLDRARDLLSEDDTDPGSPVLGSTHLPDIVGMVTGWCLVDLGRPGEAAGVLDRQLAHVPAHALRARTRFGVRRALAYALAGEIDHASRLTGELLDDIETVRSATVTTDVRRLARVLTRHERRPAVREVAPRLGLLTEARHL